MLRTLVLMLILCNAIYFALSQGQLPWFDREPQSEPLRLQQQLNVRAMRLLSSQELALLDAPAKVTARPAECLQGQFDAERGASLRAELNSALPPDSWSLEPAATPERWIVYLGKYTSPELLARKRAQLTNLGLRFEPVTNPALQPGFSLGRYDSQAAASSALERMSGRGVRTARVVLEQPGSSVMMLRLPNVDDDVRAGLESLGPAGVRAALHPCK